MKNHPKNHPVRGVRENYHNDMVTENGNFSSMDKSWSAGDLDLVHGLLEYGTTKSDLDLVLNLVESCANEITKYLKGYQSLIVSWTGVWGGSLVLAMALKTTALVVSPIFITLFLPLVEFPSWVAGEKIQIVQVCIDSSLPVLGACTCPFWFGPMTPFLDARYSIMDSMKFSL